MTGGMAVDKKYLIDQLKIFTDKYNVCADEETLGTLIDLSSFRVLPKGKLLSSIGDDTAIAGMVLSGMVRSYYVDEEGNDITRGFSPAGALCMDEGLFSFKERKCMWETLEESTLMLCEIVKIKELIRDNVIFKDIWISLLEIADSTISLTDFSSILVSFSLSNFIRSDLNLGLMSNN